MQMLQWKRNDQIMIILAYSVSFLNLLQGDRSYTKQLAKEMEEMKEKPSTTERGHEVFFKFEKWSLQFGQSAMQSHTTPY